MAHTEPQRLKIIRSAKASAVAPPAVVEYGYYFSIFYAILGGALGWSLGFFGVAMLAMLTVLCSACLGSRVWTVYAPIVFPLGCAVSFVALQVFLHGESLMADYVRPFVPWALTLIIVQSLSLRQGFVHRFALATFLIGLTLLPYLRIYTQDVAYQRSGLEQGVGLANPNNLAAWFGFCSVYFIVAGIEARRNVIRVASWLAAVGCLYIVSLTVSRGALLAAALGAVVALRRLLKRGFFPAVLLIILVWALYESGVFQQTTTFYAARATEETGRLSLWPLALERFLNSPLTGVGVSNFGTWVPSHERTITPHNGFLFFALASGILPLAFFVAYWVHAMWASLRTHAKQSTDTPFCMPLLIYAFLVMMSSNMSFASPWITVTLSTALVAGTPRRGGRIVARRRRADEHVEP